MRAAVVAVAVVLAGSLGAGIWYAAHVRKQGRPLTGAEITALVSGNTVKGPKFAEYYAADGTIRGREIEDEDEEYSGTWHTDGDRLCVVFPSHDYTNCVSISQEPGSDYQFVGSGIPGKRTIIAGNPDKL